METAIQTNGAPSATVLMLKQLRRRHPEASEAKLTVLCIKAVEDDPDLMKEMIELGCIHTVEEVLRGYV